MRHPRPRSAKADDVAEAEAFEEFEQRLRRDDGGGAAIVQGGAQGVVVERLVGDESIKIDARYERLDADAVVAVARQQDEARHTAQRRSRRLSRICRRAALEHVDVPHKPKQGRML